MHGSILAAPIVHSDPVVQTTRAVGKLRTAVVDSGSAEPMVQAVGNSSSAKLSEPAVAAAVVLADVLVDSGTQCQIVKMCAAS